MAWTYDWVAGIVSVGKWNSWVLSVLPDITGQRILEIGHGPGHLQIALAKAQKTIFGIDQSRQMGRIARRRIQAAGSNCLLVNGSAQTLPYRDQSFNHVVATFPTPYIFDLRTLQGIYRVLVPGGSLIVIPEAWITGSTPTDRIAAYAFHILGQSPSWQDSYIEPFLQAGFVATPYRRKLPTSEVMIIKAIKQNSEI
jgi:ubiquinone/menaquinone biosynthesis C-methylase UbiE